MSARPFTSHNHASRAAAVAETMRAGMTPWHDPHWLLFAMPAPSRERFAVARYMTPAGPRWCIVPESELRAHLANVAHAAGGLEVTEYATPGQEAAAGCPVALLEAAAHTDGATNTGGF